MQFHTMVNLWAVLIHKGVLSNFYLASCLKILNQSLHKPTNTKDFIFAVKVLDRCKNR
jgi:hypothetical protein